MVMWISEGTGAWRVCGQCGCGLLCGVMVWCRREEIVWGDEECDGARREAVPGVN